MKRLLALLVLLVLLPLHSSWAVAASYCQHESGKSAQHFGHHTHQHQAPADGSNDAGKPPFKLDSDCSVCHLGCTAATVSVSSASVIAPELLVFADPPDTLPSIFLEGPERPKWVPVA